jgi:ATP adenylyltransferase
MSEFLESMSGMQDNFSRLWTPHRMVYLQNGQQPKDEDCPFCLAPQKSPEDGLVVHKGKTSYVLLNMFPYNAGHLLVCPYRHVDTFDRATDEEVAEIGLLTQQGMRTLQKVSRVHGFNIGMNQGEVAGAGIASHLHQHIVPRWRNDSNFFPIIAQTKAMPKLLGEVRETIEQNWVTHL